MFSNPYVRAAIGGLVAALTVAGPLVDDGVTVSEICAIALAFLSTAGGVSVSPSGTPKPKPDASTSGWQGGA